MLKKLSKIKYFFSIIFNIITSCVVWLFPMAMLIACISIFTYIKPNIAFIEILKILIWPTTILTIAYFFRKVFTYLFFSLDEFNFFGVKGKLENVKDMISRKAEEMFLREKEAEEQGKKILSIENDLRFAKASKEKAEKRAEDNFKLAKTIFTEFKKEIDINTALKKEYEDVKAIIINHGVQLDKQEQQKAK